MPQSLVKKVANKCNMDTGEVEDIWKKAKEKAAGQGHEEDGGYITSIFKSMVPGDCKDKMNGDKNEKEEFDMNIEEKVEKYLNEKSSSSSQQKGDIVKVQKYKGELLLKVKGMKNLLGPGDMVEFKDTPTIKRLGLEPGASGEIIKINKNETVQVEANTKKSENAKITVPIADIYWTMD